jgi:hypothetical protein
VQENLGINVAREESDDDDDDGQPQRKRLRQVPILTHFNPSFPHVSS